MAAAKVALFGLFGSGNLGNGGSLEAMVAFLRSRHPNTELAVVCAGPEEVQRELGVPAFSMTWYRPADEPRAKAVVRKAVGKVVDAVRTFRWVRRFDVVVVPGTGILETTLPIRPWGFPYALLLVSVCGKLSGTKVAYVSVGADSTTQPATRWVMKTATTLADYRSYRDELSRDAMRGMGVDTSRDRVYPDLAFALPVPRAENAATKTVGVGVMAYYGTYVDRRQADDIYSTYVEKLTTFVRWLVDEGYRVRFFTGDPADESVASAVTSDLRRTRPELADTRLVTDFAPTLSGLIEQMAAVDVVVASRFHNVLSALKLAKPTISISYASKNDKLMDGMGLGEFCQPIRSLDVARLIEQFCALAATRERLTSEIFETNERNLKLLDQQFVVLSETLFSADRVTAAAGSD
ncbi:MAG TPA: polysaccharide pyruvyl transferase family protein [Kribbellaceae bacterium]|nr:polysaccharide pyruvyl transferase family protein [Kribbellaceae bacterium]